MQFFQESVTKKPYFSEMWKFALDSSEELRIGVALMREISQKFPKKEIYIVGGVPRDILLNRDIDDVDLATNISFSDLREEGFDLRNISKNDSQPVYVILYKNYVFDLAAFRKDSQEKAGRQNNISQKIDSFEEDSKRRDLTINSFGIDWKGNIKDYQNGMEDLKNEIIRTVGDPKERFMEDATRILRVFRFAAKMGFSIDPQTEQAAIELKHILGDRDHISMESISKEFYKVAKSGPALAEFIVKLDKANILESILPEFTKMKGMMHNPKHHPEGGSSVIGHILECLRVSPYNDPVINLGVLFHDFGKGVTQGKNGGGPLNYYGHEAAGVPIVSEIFKRLRFAELSSEDKNAILFATKNHMLVHSLDKLNLKSLTKLIHSPYWNVLKDVSYCDEASRGRAMFDSKQFEEKIKRAEQKVFSVGTNPRAARDAIKKYINGNLLLNWFPQVKENPVQIKHVLDDVESFVFGKIEKGEDVDQSMVKSYISGILQKYGF